LRSVFEVVSCADSTAAGQSQPGESIFAGGGGKFTEEVPVGARGILSAHGQVAENSTEFGGEFGERLKYPVSFFAPSHEMDVRNRQGKMGGMDMHMAKELNLTTEQMDKLQANKMAKEKDNIQAEADMKKLHIDLMTETMKDNPDMAAIETLTKKMGEMHGQEKLAMIKDKIFFRSLLNADQKKKLGQMMMDMEMNEKHEMGEKHEMMEKHEMKEKHEEHGK